MPSDANGNFSLVSSYFVQNGDTVLPVQHNPPLEDVAAGLTNRIMKDGRTVWTGDMKAGGFKVTGLGDGSSAGDSARIGQIGIEFDTLSAAEGYAPENAPETIRTRGYSTAGDGGGALYKKVASEPSHAGKFSITLDDGVTVVWYEIAETRINPRMLGAFGATSLTAACEIGKPIDISVEDTAVSLTSEFQVNTVLDALGLISVRGPSFTITLPAGVFERDERVVIQDRVGRKISIIGQPLTEYTFDSLRAISSSLGSRDHRVSLNLTDVSGIAVGDFLRVKATSGIGRGPVSGVWEVTNVNTGDNAVTLKVTAKKASLQTNVNVTAATVHKFNTILKFGDDLGFLCKGDNGGGSANESQIDKILLVGGESSIHGVMVEYHSKVTLGSDFAVANFQSHGIYAIYNCVVNALGVVVSGCGSNGVYAIASVVMMVNGISSGNGSNGFVSTFGSDITVSSSQAHGNENGYSSWNGGVMACRDTSAQHNDGMAYSAKGAAFMFAELGGAGFNDVAFSAVEGSNIIATGNTISGNGTNYVESTNGVIYQ